MIDLMYYCGQQDRHGHYIWPSDGTRSQLAFRRCEPDVTFELDDPDRWCSSGSRGQGAAKLTHVDGWTVFGFRDYSIDKRPGSHSTFAARGTFTAEEMEREARRLFPQVWARFTFPVTIEAP